MRLLSTTGDGSILIRDKEPVCGVLPLFSMDVLAKICLFVRGVGVRLRVLSTTTGLCRGIRWVLVLFYKVIEDSLALVQGHLF